MKKYYYVVNTFGKTQTEELSPIQLKGYIYAKNEDVAIKNLIKTGFVYAKGYEFLELSEV